MRKYDDGSGQQLQVWFRSDDGPDRDDTVLSSALALDGLGRCCWFGALSCQSRCVAFKLDQGAAGLVGETGPLFGDRLTVIEQLGFAQILARLEVVMELPLLSGFEVGVGTHRMEPDVSKSTVSFNILLVGQAGHSGDCE
jgi:hypothetical protein